MLHREAVAVCSHIHTKHIYIVCEEKAELLNVKRGGTFSDHWAISVSAFTRRFAAVGTSRR
jgi:hypothetical protein